MATAVPATLITGFLGSGKTTLLNRTLAAWKGRRVGVLVNDFGRVDVDGALVRGADAVVPLAGGCICCTIQSGFVAAATQLLERAQPPEALLIEASGISEPGPLLSAFAAPALRGRVRLDGVVAVVDAAEARGFMARRNQPLLDAQVQAATLVVLNKTDLATPGEVGRTRRWLAETAPEARIWPTEQANVPGELLVGIGAGWPPRAEDRHTDGFARAIYTPSLPFSLPRLREAVQRAPSAIYRAKGEVLLADLSERRWIVHVAGRHGTVERGDRWGVDAPRSAVVAIGRAGDLTDETLAEWLEPALAGR